MPVAKFASRLWLETGTCKKTTPRRTLNFPFILISRSVDSTHKSIQSHRNAAGYMMDVT